MNIWVSIRLWLLRQLKVDPAQPRQLRVQETLTFEDNAALNRLWYTGDADALSQVYAQLGGNGFWAKSAKNTQVQRIHTGIPGAVVDTLAQLVVSDLLDAQIADSPVLEERLAALLEDAAFHDVLEDAVAQMLFIGDGAFRVTYDGKVGVAFVPGDRVLFDGDEIVFCTRYKTAAREYLLRETYAPRRDPVRPHGQRGHRRSPRHTPGDGRARAGADVRR